MLAESALGVRDFTSARRTWVLLRGDPGGIFHARLCGARAYVWVFKGEAGWPSVPRGNVYATREEAVLAIRDAESDGRAQPGTLRVLPVVDCTQP
mgnify:CR=1 FL=1